MPYGVTYRLGVGGVCQEVCIGAVKSFGFRATLDLNSYLLVNKSSKFQLASWQPVSTAAGLTCFEVQAGRPAAQAEGGSEQLHSLLPEESL
eukprot:3284324-Amphidinium_carterae.1